MFVMFDAASRRQIAQHNENVWLAWNSAALQRAKRLPQMSKLLVKRRERRIQTIEEQRAVLRAIAATYGGFNRHGR